MKYAIFFVSLAILISTPNYSQDDHTLAIGDIVPPLNLIILNNDSVDHYAWEDLKGKIVLIDFWATWCAPCIKAIPHMNKLVEQFQQKDVVFLSVSYEPGNSGA